MAAAQLYKDVSADLTGKDDFKRWYRIGQITEFAAELFVPAGAAGKVGKAAGVVEKGMVKAEAVVVKTEIEALPKAAKGEVIASKTASQIVTKPVSELKPVEIGEMSRGRYQELVKDIANNGIKDPFDVITIKGQTYILVGNNRYNAVRKLGIKEVPTREVTLFYRGFKDENDVLWGAAEVEAIRRGGR